MVDAVSSLVEIRVQIVTDSDCRIFPIHTMTPVWVFPAYPLLLAAPFATNLIKAVINSEEDVLVNFTAIAFCAITVQGTGFLISFSKCLLMGDSQELNPHCHAAFTTDMLTTIAVICAAFLYRLMTQKLPRDMQRPGVFISIGPSGFSCAGLVALGRQTEQIIPADFPGREHVIYSAHFLSIMTGLWLWGLSLWFFLVSVGSLHKYLRREHTMPFQMTWWSFVFPNTALVTATLAMGAALSSKGLQIFGCVMAALLISVWVLVFLRMIKGFWKRELLWPKGLEAE